MEEKVILINGIKTNYKIAGQGPAILVLHGWGASSDSWLAVQKILTEKGYKIIIPDLPGFGKSKTPLEPWNITDYTRWLYDFIYLLNLNNFSIIAHSFGGRIAIKFAANYPEKIERLIFCDSAGIKSKPDIKTGIILLLTELGKTLFSLKFLSIFKEGAKNLYYLFLRNKDYVKAKGVMKEILKKVIEEDLLPHLSKIKIKTLIVWGKNDRMIPLKYAQIFKTNIQNSQLEILPKVGHSPHLEAPEKLSQIIESFLKS